MSSNQLEAIARNFCSSEGLRFIEYVTSGGFKETYKAERSDGLYVAVKVFREGMASQRTQREIEAVQRCSHPQIARFESVKIMNVGGVEHLVIIEEFLSGGTLSRQLEQVGSLSVSDTRRLAIGLVDALGHIADEVPSESV